MNSELLKIKVVDDDSICTSFVYWTLDQPTREVVVLDVEVGKVSPAPLHWRAGDWTKLPLDLRLSERGYLEGIQFVFQDESVAYADEPPCVDPRPGVRNGWLAR